MQGVDPDAPEEDEENEVEDVDGDLEETELVWCVKKVPVCGIDMMVFWYGLSAAALPNRVCRENN